MGKRAYSFQKEQTVIIWNISNVLQWPGGGDMARRLTLGEGFGDGSQDIASLPLGQPGTQAHQLVSVVFHIQQEVAILGEETVISLS